jgi:hypothetical protein
VENLNRELEAIESVNAWPPGERYLDFVWKILEGGQLERTSQGVYSHQKSRYQVFLWKISKVVIGLGVMFEGDCVDGGASGGSRMRGPSSVLEEILCTLLAVVTTVIQNTRRGCHRVPKFCMGSSLIKILGFQSDDLLRWQINIVTTIFKDTRQKR